MNRKNSLRRVELSLYRKKTLTLLTSRLASDHSLSVALVFYCTLAGRCLILFAEVISSISISTEMPDTTDTPLPASMSEYDDRDNKAWVISFAAAMVPFCAFCYGHQRGFTGKAVTRIVQSPVGVYGLLALPFVTLGMEKCIYDTVQAAQGINPNVVPADRGGFPSGGAELPSFSLVAVQPRNPPVVKKAYTDAAPMRRLTAVTDESKTK